MNSFINKLKPSACVCWLYVRTYIVPTRVPGWLRPHTQMDTKNSFTSALVMRNQKKKDKEKEKKI